MKAYMRHTPPVYFQFSWLVFIINFMISAFVGLLIGLLHKYYSGLGVGFGLLVLLYSIQGRCDDGDTRFLSPLDDTNYYTGTSVCSCECEKQSKCGSKFWKIMKIDFYNFYKP